MCVLEAGGAESETEAETHTHTERETEKETKRTRERERERERESTCFASPELLDLLCLRELGFVPRCLLPPLLLYLPRLRYVKVSVTSSSTVSLEERTCPAW